MAGSDVAVAETPADVSLVPRVVAGELVLRRRGFVSPLDGGEHCLTGGVVTDPRQVEEIHASVTYYSLPRWRRLFVTRPPRQEWTAGLPLVKINMPSQVPSPNTGEGPA